jgi:hypoxanthine phosphoribosyltransferase
LIVSTPSHIHEVYACATRLYGADEVNAALERMATDMNQTLADKNPVVLCVMVGGLVTLGNLLPRLTFPLVLDYLHATRYQNGLTGKTLEWKVKPSVALAGRHVVVVDDILERGITLQAIIDACYQQGAEQVYSAVLIDKDCPRDPKGANQVDFAGLAVADRYIFGYGLDYKEYLRNAPGIYAVADEHQ